MILKLNEIEIKLLESLKDGFSQLLVYKAGLYPSRVSFILNNGKRVTLGARGEDIAPRFEVFPLTVSEEVLSSDPEKIFQFKDGYKQNDITILQKSEWAVPSDQDVRDQLLSDPCGSTTQYEGTYAEIPAAALNKATLHAGVEVNFTNGQSFLVATSMFPYSLYVSDCDFSETIDVGVYEHIKL